MIVQTADAFVLLILLSQFVEYFLNSIQQNKKFYRIKRKENNFKAPKIIKKEIVYGLFKNK